MTDKSDDFVPISTLFIRKQKFTWLQTTLLMIAFRKCNCLLHLNRQFYFLLNAFRFGYDNVVWCLTRSIKKNSSYGNHFLNTSDLLHLKKIFIPSLKEVVTHLCMQYSLLPCFFGKVAECNRSKIPNQVAAPQKLSVIGCQTFR